MKGLKSLRRSLACAIVFVFIAATAIPALACTTIVVGKDASASGDVLLGHNEDDGGRMIMSQNYVPRMEHEPGEMITDLEGTYAEIPQVPETYAYYWSEARTPGGASFADCYRNEFGVSIVSDSCASSKETGGELKDGGIGYGLRRLMAERATSARNAVEVAVSLLNEYGYAASGRTYTIADGKEAWSLQIVKGKHYVAERIPDDAVYVISNRYTIRAVDLNDQDNFIASPDLITYAISKGWYTPAVPGDYSDFDFAMAYESPGTWNSQGNIIRQQHAWQILLDQEYPQPDEIPFSLKADTKVGIDDIKEVLRTHYEGTPDDLTNGYTAQPSTPHYSGKRVICTSTTMESDIFQLRENPLFDVMWRTTLRPCTSPYVPWYPGTGKIPEGYSWLDPEFAQNTHFNPPVSDYDYDQNKAFWAFSDLQNLVDPMYGQVIDKVQPSIFEMENNWTAKQKGIENAAMNQYKKDPEKAGEFLAKYSDQAANQAWDWAKDMYNELATVKIDIMADVLSKTDTGNVSVAILSSDTFDATITDSASISMGVGYRNAATWGKATGAEVKDVDGDGLNDLVATFTTSSIIGSSSIPPCEMELFLQGNNNGTIFAAEDVVTIAQ